MCRFCQLPLSPFCLAPLTALALIATGCASETAATPDDFAVESNFSSNQATLLNFEFDAEAWIDDGEEPTTETLTSHLLFTIGHLNGDNAVGRLDNVKLTDVKKVESKGPRSLVSYHAVLPVSWGSKTDLPKSYELTLPHDVTFSGVDAFTEKYMKGCVEHGAHDVDSGSIWYYYRPHLKGCALDPADVMKSTAKVTVSTENTSGKYPEYNKIWEDKALNVVAVFGKYEKGATSDEGIRGYAEFVHAIKDTLKGSKVTTLPETLPTVIDGKTPDIEIRATLSGGRTVKVNALLVDEVSTAPQSFYERYEGLSTDADMIAYNGHAGLGQNVRALSNHGKFVKGKYLVVFMNGCDTFAYVDGSLARKRATINPDDPTGTKYMEFVTNAMPAFFHEMPSASLALFNAFMAPEKPLSYDKIFEGVDDSQVIGVTGEEDNAFTPGK